MPSSKELYSASEAARALGISLDTLRRWDRDGRIRTQRDRANRRLVPAAEIDRLLVDTIRTTFPSYEHEQFVEHYRSLLGAWARDYRASVA